MLYISLLLPLIFRTIFMENKPNMSTLSKIRHQRFGRMSKEATKTKDERMQHIIYQQ